MLTNDELQAIRARCEAATPGPPKNPQVNDTIMAIAANISSLSCAECDPFYSGRKCQDREEQCRVHFRTMAAHVYTAHVKPLEDALAKAESDKAALVGALESCLNLLEYNGFQGGIVVKARAALARVKESQCPKN